MTQIEEKGRPGDLLTEADRAAEAAVLSVLERHYPEHAVLAEESGWSGDRQQEFSWAVDPLDGTTNYAHGYLHRAEPQSPFICSKSANRLACSMRLLEANWLWWPPAQKG
ncbi:inositol monophosphatase family protein [Synechococcus elongatus IITB5]